MEGRTELESGWILLVIQVCLCGPIGGWCAVMVLPRWCGVVLCVGGVGNGKLLGKWVQHLFEFLHSRFECGMVATNSN